MFDTVAISKSTFAKPNLTLLENNGGKVFFSQFTGEPYKIALNGEKGAKEPRITFSRSPKEHWIIKAETSIGAWLFNSNIFLPNESDIKIFLSMLSEYIADQTGIRFDAHLERVTRLDPVRDFEVGESRVLSILKELTKIELPKYDRKPINDTGVYFVNKGKIKNKKYAIYSKYHEMLANGASATELELAEGILRFEIEHKNNRSVSDLSHSLKYPNHNAKYLLTRNTSERTLEKAMNLLNFENILESTNDNLQNLGLTYDSLTAIKLAGHLTYKKQFGSDYYKLPFIQLSPKTVKRYEKQCKKAGVLSLE